MQIHQLRLINFRQHEDTTLAFGVGLTGVIGPNGAGKTTLLEALAWALYGTRAARGTVEGIRRRNAPPRARVEVAVEFTLGPHRYRVVRTLHGAELAAHLLPADRIGLGPCERGDLARDRRLVEIADPHDVALLAWRIAAGHQEIG